MPVRKIQTEISIGGEKAFNDAMKSSNSNLKTLRTDMAAVSSEFRKSENSIQALTAGRSYQPSPNASKRSRRPPAAKAPPRTNSGSRSIPRPWP